MNSEFRLYLAQKQMEDQDLILSRGFWWEADDLLLRCGGRIRETLEVVRERAHDAPPADREGFRHLYRFLAGIRRSERAINSAKARKAASKKRAMYQEQLGNKLRAAFK